MPPHELRDPRGGTLVSTPNSDSPARLPSIQGETVRDPGPVEWASEQEVDEYVDNHSEETVDCRLGTHHYLTPRSGAIFNDVDRDGNFIAEYQCTCCKCAYRREVWIPTGKRRGRVRWEMVDVTTIYRKGPNGETYLMPPGTGRMKKIRVRESVVSKAMAGQSPAALRKAIRRDRDRE